MAELINLRRARKQRARADREIEAEAHRARYGVSRREREIEAARKEKSARDLESSRLDDKKK